MNNSTPWFNSEAIEYLSSLLKPNWSLLETGCGSSTIWYANRVKRVVSFESVEEWFNEVREIIERKKIENIELHLYPNYPIEGINNFKNNEFDFISIDGRGRVKSIETVVPYLKSDGYLMLDDSQRERYKPVLVLLADWEAMTLGKNEKKSTIWRKP